MKKTSTLLFTAMILLIFSLCGCAKSENEIITGEAFNSTESINKTQSTDTEKPEEYRPTTVKMSAYNKDNIEQYFNITFPTAHLREVFYGRGMATKEELRAFCGASFLSETIECSSIENIYDAYVSRWEESAEDMLHYKEYSDCKFTEEKHEMTEINGFSMCRYEGTLAYNYTDFGTNEVTPRSCYFVAYGTQLSEGGYVYWIVFDNSVDQSLKALVNSSAENMAKSLEETTLM